MDAAAIEMKRTQLLTSEKHSVSPWTLRGKQGKKIRWSGHDGDRMMIGWTECGR